MLVDTDKLHSHVRFSKGVYIGHLNPHLDLYNGTHSYEDAYPQFTNGVDVFGVCDSPAQLLKAIGDKVEKDPRKFVICLTHIHKEPEFKGKSGGWRWHKWGPYIGEGEPTCEYLDDEEKFENGIYVYHIYQISNEGA